MNAQVEQTTLKYYNSENQSMSLRTYKQHIFLETN